VNAYGEPVSEAVVFPGGNEFNLSLGRDSSGRIVSREEKTPSGDVRWDYQFDAAGRLVEVEKDNSPYASYRYDANGNRTSVTLEGETQAATFDARDRIATQGDLSFRYNKSGEMVEKRDTSSGKVSSFAYDSFGRLTSATGEGGQEISYRLDAAGRRAVRTVDGEVTARFVYAPGIQGPLAELAGDNTTRARYIYASRSNVPDYMEKGGRRYRLLTDQLGSVRLVVDAESGEVAQAMTYDPFGRVLSDSNSGFQPFGFAGGPYDPATGLTHFGAREYDAQVGRWTSADPISFAGGDANLYGYVLGDPVNLVDPSGLYVLNYPGQNLIHTIGGAADSIVRAAMPNFGDACGRSYLQRAWDNFRNTNTSIAGVLAPTGTGLITSARVAEAMGQTPLREYLLRTMESPSQIFTLLRDAPKLAKTASLNALLIGGVWEAGVGIGSLMSAAYMCSCQ
jgi:RHS repeat-associated protein